MTIQKYRIAALLLAGVFCLFNVGLPIVVASCPMAEMSKTGRACACTTTDTPYQSAKVSSSSCCKSLIAAERNTNEFLQAAVPHLAMDGLHAVAVFPMDVLLRSTSQKSPQIASSPPLSSFAEDIPVHISSLLI